MKIAIVGYGKMGHMIASLAEKRGHSIVATVDPYAPDATIKADGAVCAKTELAAAKPDVVIEFSHPDAVLKNISALLTIGCPVIVGTTGWYSKLDEVKKEVAACNGNLFYAANYAIGVNLFYRMVENAAKLMAKYDEYDVAVWETHHNEKADSPSGTALDIARRIMAQTPSKTEMVCGNFDGKPKANQLHVSSTRVGRMPGTHTVFFDSAADTVELTHTSRSREGLAMGAIHAAEWMLSSLASGKAVKGNVYTMDDLLA